MPPPSSDRPTPGVYVTEPGAYPSPVVGVETALPAFIGYTQTATLNGEPVVGQAIRIGSLAEYEAVFGRGHTRLFTLDEVDGPPGDEGDDVSVAPAPGEAPRYHRLAPVDGTQYVLYESMRLFFANGGGLCVVVSVGDFDAPLTLADLQNGLRAVGDQVGPTMLVVPDAMGLSSEADAAALASGMLAQCAALRDRVAILDVWGTDRIDPTASPLQAQIDPVITAFRRAVGDESLSYGVAYFPTLNTSVVQAGEIDYTHIDAASLPTLQALLTDQADALYGGTPHDAAVKTDIDAIATPAADDQVRATNQRLTSALPVLAEIERLIAQTHNVLPPSGAMAGVYARVDGELGVWQAPANTPLASVVSPTLSLTDDLQADLNTPVDGKAVNALREFPGRGTVVWGARTLDGNSNDWRYIQVRRTIIYVEQSIKNALDPFVFAANDGNTWAAVTAMTSTFLQGLWSQGGLMGATPGEAYTVQCGLGSTMTGQDLLDGYMVVQVTLQMIRPAEFIELTFRQKMEGVA